MLSLLNFELFVESKDFIDYQTKINQLAEDQIALLEDNSNDDPFKFEANVLSQSLFDLST